MNDKLIARPSSSNNGRHVFFQSEIHFTGFITILLEISLLLENLLPLLVVVWWKRPGERTVCDKLIAALSLTYITSAIIPTPFGLVSYFHGSWFGGKETCECFQVTTTFCSLSAMALVTYMCLDRHLSACPCAGFKIRTECRDNFGVMLFFLFISTLTISTLPVIGLGPEIMAGNDTCDAWIILIPDPGKREIYFISFLSFGFVNIFLSTVSSLYLIVLLHRPQRSLEVSETGASTDDSDLDVLHSSSSENSTWVILALVFLNQVTWIPTLTMITFQKVGMKVSEAAMMYALLATSLPGLLNPLLYGLVLDSYRDGYKKILLKIFFCYKPKDVHTQQLRGVRPSNYDGGRLCRIIIDGQVHSKSKQTAGTDNPLFEGDSVPATSRNASFPSQGATAAEDVILCSNDDDVENSRTTSLRDQSNEDILVHSGSEGEITSSCSSEEYLLGSDDSNLNVNYVDESAI